MRRLRNGRGAALWIVIVTALICSVAAYTMLMMAVSQARRGQFYANRTKARYAAEAGLVWAMQRLWQAPTNFTAGTTDVTVDGMNVDVIGACNPGPCTLQAKVMY